MEKIFAVVWPSSYPTPGLAAICDTFTDIYHYFKYPSFDRYSLSKAEFYDTLADAKVRLGRSTYGGIIELDVEGDEVKNITSIFSPQSNGASPAALQTLTDMLKVRYVKAHEVDAKSTHPKAKLCRQLSTKFNEDHGKPEKIKVTDAECFATVGSGISFGAGMFVGLAALACPEELCPIAATEAVASLIRIAGATTIAAPFILLGTILAIAGTYRHRNAAFKEANKSEYIRNNLFSDKASSSSGEDSQHPASLNLSH